MELSIDESSRLERIIILLDLDFFYGQVEQIRDPRLQGLAFVIKQKGIVATASYPARRLGIKKLQSYADAKRLVPDLITIVGEDLTPYRLASKDIRGVVTSLVWGGKAEKLGLDELFLDVTDQINSHLQSLLPRHPRIGSEQTFQVDPPEAVSSRSFTYPFGSYTGFLEPPFDSKPSRSNLPYSALQLFVASHFAQYIRTELFSALGYTTSAGIASNKLVSKLLSDLHKPALQSVQNQYATPEERQEWLDNFKVEKLNGFGFRTGWILRHHIFGEEMPPKGAYGDPDKVNGSFFEETVQDDEVMSLRDAQANGRTVTGGLTVGKVRTSTTAEKFYAWFGGRVGPRLWGLLHGIDDTEVIATPPFPKQISVEDSYPDNNSMKTLLIGLATLTKSLVRRLDLDLKVGDAYVRFPKTLRLTMRNGRQVSRESKSTRMPVELFDRTLPTEKRIEMVGRAMSALARGMVAGWSPGWKVGVINVAATDLVEEVPGQGIQGFIDKPRREAEIDWEVIKELPEDIRVEVMKQYRLSPEKLDVMKTEAEDDEMETEDDDWDDGDEDLEATKEACNICGVRIFAWMSEAHARYHNSLS